MTTTTTKFATASKLAARWDVGFERSTSDASWATTESLRGAEADALVTDLQSAGIEASKAYDTDERSRAWVYASLDEERPATLTAETITCAQITGLLDEATAHGDAGMAAICRKAIELSARGLGTEARQACADAINARAQGRR